MGPVEHASYASNRCDGRVSVDHGSSRHFDFVQLSGSNYGPEFTVYSGTDAQHGELDQTGDDLPLRVCADGDYRSRSEPRVSLVGFDDSDIYACCLWHGRLVRVGHCQGSESARKLANGGLRLNQTRTAKSREVWNRGGLVS